MAVPARSRRSVWERARLGLLVAALAALVAFVFQIVLVLMTTPVLQSVSIGWIAAVALIVYLGAHGFRILRLGMLIGGWRVGLRTIAFFHLMTAGVSAALPLKLGEVYRVVELSSLAGSLDRKSVV